MQEQGLRVDDVRITGIDAYGVRSPDIQKSRNVLRDEAVIVEVSTDAGISGWAEINGHIPALVALVEFEGPHPRDRGPRAALVGRPLGELHALIQELRASAIITGRAGLGRVAIGGIETALVDLYGRLTGRPAWQIMSGAETPPVARAVRPYITIYNRGSYADVLRRGIDDIERAQEYGYRSFKIEATDYNTDEREAIDLVRSIREHFGTGIELSVDNVYRWTSVRSAVEAARAYLALGAVFLEDPFLPERWDWLRELRDAVPLRLAAGGAMVTTTQFIAQMELGGADIVQPGPHLSGVIGAREVVLEAESRGRSVTTFGVSATSLTAAAQVHLAVCHQNIVMVEYAPYALFGNLRLRADIAGPEPELENGAFVLPTSPGFGVDCHRDAISEYRVAV
ncbi:mandelate racemase/muconate lactonizing enzyme family protein [Microbacterium pseudoresistens]